jgi:hypothetical protein
MENIDITNYPPLINILHYKRIEAGGGTLGVIRHAYTYWKIVAH